MSHDRPSICTASGLEFWPFEPRPEFIELEDIAHHLAGCNRFSGATRIPYSVAQHSVLVADLVRSGGGPRVAQRIALLHDASEAYLGDMPGPIKRHPYLAEYRAAESRLQALIYARFGFTDRQLEVWQPAVDNADRRMLHAEQCDLMPDCDWLGHPYDTKVPTVFPVSASAAETRFLDRAADLELS